MFMKLVARCISTSIRQMFFFTLFVVSSTTMQAQNLPVPAAYQELHRPQYHFTPAAHWMNDPNGLVYFKGEYHLFYQYYPDGLVWGPMHWGHAVSTDMVHWKHLPIALYPDSLGYIFSGSVVIDWKNSSGLGKAGQPPMIALYTYHNMDGEKSGRTDYQYQGLAFSNDRGRTWTKYAQNPVIPNNGSKDFRDPKVFWHAQSERWIMVLAVKDKAMFYSSINLTAWTYESAFGLPKETRLWECPDLFAIKEEISGKTKWVLMVSMQTGAPNGGTGTSYFVGEFDGHQFTNTEPNQPQYWLDYGTDNYATVTFSDIPKADGRRLAMGWMSNWQYAQEVPTAPWRSAMTMVRELRLTPVSGSSKLRSVPIAATKSLEQKTIDLSALLNSQKAYRSSQLASSKIQLKFDGNIKDSLTIRLSNARGEWLDLGYDPASRRFFVDRTHAGAANFNPLFAARHYAPKVLDSKSVDLTIYLDQSALELFADGGLVSMTEIYFPSAPFDRLEVLPTKAASTVRSLTMTPLRSIWGR